MNFNPDCQHHLQMEISPERRMWYQFGCRKCPGKILIPAKDTRGKTIEKLYAGALAAAEGNAA